MFSLKSIRNATTPSIKLHYKIILCGLNKSRLQSDLTMMAFLRTTERGHCGEMAIVGR